MTRALFLAFAFAALPALASGPYETFGVDARGKGMGNARVAGADDWSAGYYNPAGLARVERFHLELHSTFSVPSTAVVLDNANPDPALTPRLPAPVAGNTLGLAFPLGGFLEDIAYAGISLHAPLLVLSHASAPDPGRPFFLLYDTYSDRLELTAAFSVKWIDWFATGAGIRLGAGQRGKISLAIDPLLRRVTQQEIEGSQVPVVAPTLGVALGPLGLDGVIEIKGGFVFRGAIATDLIVDAEVSVDGLDLELALPVSILANYTPETWVLGTSFTFLDRVEVEADLAWMFWSRAPSPYLNAIVTIGGEGAEELGVDGELDAPGPGEDRVVPPGFVDTLNVRVGASYALTEGATVRAGYAWRPTPVPDQTSGNNIVDLNAHILSVGGGVEVLMPFIAKRPVRIDFAWQTQLLQERRIEKRGADPTGSYTASGLVNELSMGMGLSF